MSLLTEVHSQQLKDELVHHKEIAAELEHELQWQARESGLRDEMAVELAKVRELSHCLRKKVVKVAPELASRSANGTTRGFASSSSRRGSRLVSSGSSHAASTPRRPPSGASPVSVRIPGSVRERSRSPSFSPDLATVPPLIQSSHSYQETTHDPGAPWTNEVLHMQRNAEQASLVDVQPGIVGPVILVSEDNQVKEVHRQWHPEANTPPGSAACEVNHLESETLHGRVQECDRSSQCHHLQSQMSTRQDSIQSQVGSSSGEVHESDRRQNELHAKEHRSGSPTSDKLRSPRIRRVRGNVDIFSPPENVAENENANERRDPRYKPVAPFNSNDGVRWTRPNSQ
jgi:hypothetical protein